MYKFFFNKPIFFLEIDYKIYINDLYNYTSTILFYYNNLSEKLIQVI